MARESLARLVKLTPKLFLVIFQEANLGADGVDGLIARLALAVVVADGLAVMLLLRLQGADTFPKISDSLVVLLGLLESIRQEPLDTAELRRDGIKKLLKLTHLPLSFLSTNPRSPYPFTRVFTMDRNSAMEPL